MDKKRTGEENRRTYTTEEVAEMAGVAEATVRKQIRAGEIRSIRMGRRILIPATEVDRLFGEQGTIPKPSQPPRTDPYDEFEKALLDRRMIPGVNAKIGAVLKGFDEYREGEALEKVIKKIAGNT